MGSISSVRSSEIEQIKVLSSEQGIAQQSHVKVGCFVIANELPERSNRARVLPAAAVCATALRERSGQRAAAASGRAGRKIALYGQLHQTRTEGGRVSRIHRTLRMGAQLSGQRWLKE